MRRSSKAAKGKRKVAAKKARSAVRRRAMPERMRSDRHISVVTHAATKRGTNEASDTPRAASLVTNAPPNVADQSAGSDPSQRPDVRMRGMAMYPQTIATALPGLQAWFLFPIRAFQIWQEAWFRLLPR